MGVEEDLRFALKEAGQKMVVASLEATRTVDISSATITMGEPFISFSRDDGLGL